MSYLPTLLLALMLAAAPVAEAAGYDGHGHAHGGTSHAPDGHADGGHHGDAGVSSKNQDCDDPGGDLCCGDDGIACLSSYLPGRAPGQTVLTAASAPLVLGHDSAPDLLFHEYDPPPPRG